MQPARKIAHTSAALMAALVLSLLGLAAPQARADVAQVTVVSPGGGEQTLALEALAGSEDVVGRDYVLRGGSGESVQPVTGFSLARILDAAGADPYGFSYLEVQRPAGGAVLLGRDQALAGGDGAPAVYASPTGTGFLRPSTGPEDVNAGDSFTAPQGIAIVLRKGAHLKVKATASTRRTRPGQPVDFSAVVEQAGAGEQLEYSWYFDDGSSAGGAEATHSFSKRGSYDVVVGVTSDGTETGTSAVVTIQVGAPISGPNRKGGGRSDSASAPDHGVADGSAGGAAATPLTTGAAPGRSGRAPTDTQRSRRLRVRRGMTGPASPAANREPAPGERVVGELVSASTDVAPPVVEQAAARSGHLGDDGGGGGIPGAAWGILATVALLGAGAVVETRSLLP